MRSLRVAILLALFMTSACNRGPDQWDAFVYPNRSDLTQNETIKGFKSFELCQQAAISRMRIIEVEEGGDYECGYRCKPDAGLGGINVCKETRK